MTILQIVVTSALAAAIVAVLLVTPDYRIRTVAFEVPCDLVLDHYARAIRRACDEAPGFRVVEIDLGDLFVADERSLETLIHVQRSVENAEGSLYISAIPAVVAVLSARGLPATPRVPSQAPK
jgi:hypothetical protein